MIRRQLFALLFAFTLAVSLFAQIDVADKNYLESTSYYLTADTGQTDTTANLIFKFKNDAGRYQYMLSGDSLIVEFYEAYFDQNTVQGKVGLPFQCMNMAMTKEKMQSIENIGATAVDVVRIGCQLTKGAKPKVSTSSLRRVATVNLSWLKAGVGAAEESEYTSNVWKYLLIGGTAILAVSGIIYAVQTTSRTKTDVVQVK
jgi:hypothetical protein